MATLKNFRADGIKAYQLYFLIQFFTTTAVYIIMEYVFFRDYFYYPDLTVTNQLSGYFACNAETPNFAYTLGVCALGITDLSNWQAVILALFLNTARDLIIINIALDSLKTEHKIRMVYFVVTLIALNPYLSYNYLRLTTDTFGCLGILHIFVAAYYREPLTLKFLLIACLLVSIRNPLAQAYLAYIFLSAYIHFNKSSLLRILFFSMCIIGLIFSFGGIEYFSLLGLGFKYGPYSLFEIILWFEHLPKYFAIILSIIILVPIHLFLLLGARELITGYGFITMFEGGVLSSFFSLSFLAIMLFINSFSFYGTIKYFFRKNWLVLSVFAYVIPSFLIVAHLRYLYPLMPILSLGLVLWANENEKIGRVLNNYFARKSPS